ncbi:MAG TPA: carbohydrate kinase family protein [Candidatus Acidoferrales bacterium]|nr:carbohydrate kinase family protein [Candidatus Acidoferrales bacterium]
MAAETEVVGLGSCTVDFFALVPKLIAAEEKINATRLEIHAGGVTANNLTQVARLGATAGWIGLIGDDENGRIIQKEFAEDGMDETGIEVVKGEHSSFTWIPVDEQGERSIYMFPNVTAKVTPKQIRTRFARHIGQARHFHTEASQLPLPPVLEAIRVAREAGVRVIFDLDVDPTYFVEAGLGTKDELLEALRLTDVLKPCKAAARELTSASGYEQMARRLLTYGPKLVAITMGVEGCLIASNEGIAHAPPFRVKVVDTTGAGDAFMGGLSYALLQGWDDERVGLFANACAALCCTQVGARAMAKLSEVNAFIQSNSPQATSAD